MMFIKFTVMTMTFKAGLAMRGSAQQRLAPLQRLAKDTAAKIETLRIMQGRTPRSKDLPVYDHLTGTFNKDPDALRWVKSDDENVILEMCIEKKKCKLTSSSKEMALSYHCNLLELQHGVSTEDEEWFDHLTARSTWNMFPYKRSLGPRKIMLFFADATPPKKSDKKQNEANRETIATESKDESNKNPEHEPVTNNNTVSSEARRQRANEARRQRANEARVTPDAVRLVLQETFMQRLHLLGVDSMHDVEVKNFIEIIDDAVKRKEFVLNHMCKVLPSSLCLLWRQALNELSVLGKSLFPESMLEQMRDEFLQQAMPAARAGPQGREQVSTLANAQPEETKETDDEKQPVPDAPIHDEPTGTSASVPACEGSRDSGSPPSVADITKFKLQMQKDFMEFLDKDTEFKTLRDDCRLESAITLWAQLTTAAEEGVCILGDKIFLENPYILNAVMQRVTLLARQKTQERFGSYKDYEDFMQHVYQSESGAQGSIPTAPSGRASTQPAQPAKNRQEAKSPEGDELNLQPMDIPADYGTAKQFLLKVQESESVFLSYVWNNAYFYDQYTSKETASVRNWFNARVFEKKESSLLYAQINTPVKNELTRIIRAAVKKHQECRAARPARASNSPVSRTSNAQQSQIAPPAHDEKTDAPDQKNNILPPPKARDLSPNNKSLPEKIKMHMAYNSMMSPKMQDWFKRMGKTYPDWPDMPSINYWLDSYDLASQGFGQVEPFPHECIKREVERIMRVIDKNKIEEFSARYNAARQGREYYGHHYKN